MIVSFIALLLLLEWQFLNYVVASHNICEKMNPYTEALAILNFTGDIQAYCDLVGTCGIYVEKEANLIAVGPIVLPMPTAISPPPLESIVESFIIDY